MVNLLLDNNDSRGGEDLAALFNTRTLHNAVPVDSRSIKKVVLQLLHADLPVVIPQDVDRISPSMSTVLAILQKLGISIYRTNDYINAINSPAPAHAARQTSMEPVAGGSLMHA